jgi:transcriptional regulator GlxA family with amidase domain
MTTRSTDPIHVSLVVFRECDPSIVYGVYDTLWAAGWLWDSITTRRPLDLPPPDARARSGAADDGPGGLRAEPRRLFAPRLVAAERGPLELCTGVSIVPQDTVADVARTDIVFVPNVMVTAKSLKSLDRRLLDWIGRMHAAGAQLYAACGGSLVLAEAGLLDGEEATTHWSYAPLFRRLYPNVKVREDRILVQGGSGHSIVCSGGASSWQDLALLLIARHAGTEEAIRVSKVFLYQWHRDGQLPYASMMANVDHGDSAIERCQTWLAQNYQRADIVAELVRRSGLPKRTFDRRFRAATGYSPLAYIQALRIEEAKQLLETGSAPVEAVAREVGYEDTASFRRLFRRLAGMTPGDYRRKFQLPHMVAHTAAGAMPHLSVGGLRAPAGAPRDAASEGATGSASARAKPLAST